MRYLFGSAGTRELTTLLTSTPLLAFDFDGTLAPLSEQPARSALRATTRRLLTRIAKAHRVVVISGRSRADLEPRFHGVPVASIAGNHGIEPFGETAAVARLVAGWRRDLANDLSHLPGVWVEDKRYSLTVDYRHAPDLQATEAAIHHAARNLPRARLLGGRHADFNLTPDGAPNKGTALRRYMTMFKRRAALYVGDDRTDEDVFSLGLPQVMSVRVGQRRGSSARFFMREQREIDRLLTMILDGVARLGQ
jgi:trehalose 6-phosphate phosphatase